MKKYIKYKNFVPIEIIDNFQKENINNNQRLIILLLILNIIYFPSTIKSLEGILNLKNSIEIKESIPVINKVEEDINKTNLYKIINYINGNTISMEFKNNNGQIKVNNKNDIFTIEKEGKFYIQSINKIKEDCFILEVSL